MRRRFAVAAAALALSAALTVPAYAGTWKYVNDQWKYQKGTNKFAYNEWIKDNGKYYYIGNDGIMKIGWQQIDGQWYYLDQTGAMQIGWLKSDDGKWYFLYPNGAMAVNTVIDGRTIGEDGVWVPNEGDTEPANSMDLENGYLVQNLEGITKKDYTIIASGKTAAGSRWGNAIRLKGKGNPGMGSGEAGDLLLKVHVGTRPGYERKGMDVYTSTEVPFMTAVLGGEIIVPTLYGNVSCKIKEGTRCGSKIRLAGRGIVSMKDPKIKGDQYVTIQIAVPQNLTEDAKRKLKEFTDACKTSSRHAA